MALSLLQSNFESFSGGDHMRMQFFCILEDFFEMGILVVGVMVIERDPLDSGFDAGAYGLFPAAMSPANVLGQFFGRVLGIDDEEVCVFRQRHDVAVAPAGAMFHVSA